MSTINNKDQGYEGRGKKALDKVLDAAIEPLTDMAIDYIIKAINLIPNAVNWVGNEVKEKIFSANEKNQALLKKEFEASFKKKFEMMTNELINDCAEIGLKMGEERKEHFMIEAMKKNGFSPKQIELIKYDANTIYDEAAKLLEKEKKK